MRVRVLKYSGWKLPDIRYGPEGSLEGILDGRDRRRPMVEMEDNQWCCGYEREDGRPGHQVRRDLDAGS